MGEADESKREPEAAEEQPKFVFPTRRGADQPEETQEEPLAILCSVPVTEAVAFCDRLEAEGIPCGAQQSSQSTSTPVGDGLTAVTVFADVWVRAEDLDIAREILARPLEEPDEEETPAERDARFAANWICPRCQRPGLELLPISRGMWHLRMGCLGMLIIPIAITWLSWLLPSLNRVGPLPDWAIVCWLIVGLCMAWACVLPQRQKACKTCGWRTTDN